MVDYDVQALGKMRLKNGGGDTIPSLSDLLSLVGGYVPLVLEVKNSWPRDRAFEINIAEQLSRYEGPVAVMSFDPYTVAAFRKDAPGVPRGARVRTVPQHSR